VHGADADNLAARPRTRRLLLAAKLSDRVLSAQELASQIDVDDILPLLERQIGHGTVLLNAGIRDQYIEPTELGYNGLEHAANVIAPCDVRADCKGLTAALLDLFDNLLGSLRTTAIVDAHARAGRAKRNADRGANARAGTSDEGCLAKE
jgi:hypothetical protein